MEDQERFGLSRIGQIAIAVHDVERSRDFYRDVLGIPVLFEVSGMAFLDCGGVRLMLARAEEAEHDHPGSVLYFQVDDIRRSHEILTARGVEFLRPPHVIADLGSRELWMAFFRDAERTTLALMSEVPKEQP